MHKKTLLGLFLALALAVPASHAVAQLTNPFEGGGYDAHIDPDGKVHCINAGTRCTA